MPGSEELEVLSPSFIEIVQVTHAQDRNKKRIAHPKQYLATAHEIAPRKNGENHLQAVVTTVSGKVYLASRVPGLKSSTEDPPHGACCTANPYASGQTSWVCGVEACRRGARSGVVLVI
ncbi:hypothetical protein AVEN_179075-1 [Araneus ventricosus]|uniref:Uncharacterized protein n=1 Tax=Araneus ventricosus TaxID=182803 RepID=A0A4Y2QC36_ARAVE|nr:hypothetical protein AVEN_179075-1 [Araneus ventricosus]